MMLDISDILTDPDFQVEIQLERRTESVDEHGRTMLAGEQIEIVACVQPLTPQELERLPEADRDRDSLAVWSRYMLRGTGPDHAPDVILWRGRAYEVTGIEHWPGWWKAIVQALPEGEHGLQP